MNMHTRIDLPKGVRHWIYDGSAIPDWVQNDVRGDVLPNGTFHINTPVGTARVHFGNVVIQHRGDLWCRNPEEVCDLVAGLRAEELDNVTAIGPGKTAQFGTKGKSAVTKGFRAIVGAPPIIEWVAPAHLSVDPSYQRSIENAASRRLIASIAASFDWRLFSSLIVSARPDGSRVIIDGQHRWAAAMRRGDLTHLPCCSFSYPTPEDEARMFITANRARKSMNRLDDFYAALAAADEDALDIHRLVTEAGLTVSRSMSVAARQPGEITFTSSIASALRRHGEQIVSAALTSMSEAFAGHVMAQGSSVFNALALLFADPPEGFDPDTLVAALRRVDSDGFQNVIRDVQGSEERSVALRNAIVSALAFRKPRVAAA